MTNIMAVVNTPDQEGEGPSKEPIGIVMADGLSSGLGEKSGGNQKVFPIGPHYLLGTGPGDKIVFIAEALLEQYAADTTPLDLSKKAYEIIGKHFVDPTEGLNFIVAGPGKKNLEVYQLKTSRFNVPQYLKGGYAFDGSGADFVIKAINRDQQKGLPVLDQVQGNLSDLTADLFDFAYVATKSSGVNFELQYGFLTPGGNATLMHPNVRVSFPTPEYFDKDGKFDMDKKKQNDECYITLENKLIGIIQLTRVCNQITGRLRGNGNSDPQSVHKELDDVVKALRDVHSEVQDLIEGYVARHQEKPKSSPSVPSFGGFKSQFCL